VLFKTAAGVVFLSLAAAPQSPDNSACASCHEQAQKIQGMAHAPVACGKCHEKHESYPHPEGLPKPVCAACHASIAAQHARSIHGLRLKAGDASAPECGACHGTAHEIVKASSASFRAKVPETCGMCHDAIAAEFKASVHGQLSARGEANAPVCTTCHGEHLIIAKREAASPVNARNVKDTCGQCHGNVRLARRFGLPADRIVTFDASFHGLAAKGGSQTVANCSSCHGIHGILPSRDPRSTIHPRNLPNTCGHCHPGAGKRFALGQVHQSVGGTEPAAVVWVRGFYFIVIPVTIGLMLLHNAGDWLRKLVALQRKPRAAGEDQVRMLPFERFQHALLASSFCVLAWTGFALQYPDQWWARPLMFFENGWSLRRNVHRIASVVFMAVAVLHLASLIASPKLRGHWRELVPRWNDVREAAANFAYNIGLVRNKPSRASHGYIEKAEYWAVVWGGILMIATGALLWANNLAMAWLPKAWLDVATSIHWYEAILAVSAIVVWHFYSVIFDPDVYPLDTAFLTGRGPSKTTGQSPNP
jgi:cytochrome b subunit of formate dehydrogenase